MIGEGIPRVLVGSKSDLDGFREVGTEEGKACADRWGVPFLECSAKQGHNVKDVFHTLLRLTAKDSGLLVEPKPSRCVLL